MAQPFKIRFLTGVVIFSWLTCVYTPYSAQAATIVEYFNDYSTTSGTLVGKNGGSGWSGAWQNTGSTYTAGSQISYSGTGYSNPDNQNDTNDGRATGASTSALSYRNFTGLTGTVWISFLTFQTSNGDILFWLDKTDATTNGAGRDFVALRGSTGTSGTLSPPEPLIAYNGTDDSANNTDLAINTSHMVLLRIDMKYSAALDRIYFWVDPNLSSGAAGLGLTVGGANGPAYLKDNADTYGTTFDGIGLSFSATSNSVDAIRISNEANGFEMVTIPEPATSLLFVLGLLGVILVVRRNQDHTARV